VKKPCSPALSSVVAGLYLQKKKMYVDHELYISCDEMKRSCFCIFRFMWEFTHLNLFLALCRLPSSASSDHSEGLSHGEISSRKYVIVAFEIMT
jgi:hypothetical protein